MRFLITGASGFVGYALAMRLAETHGKGALQLLVSPTPRTEEEGRRLGALRDGGYEVLAVDLLSDPLDTSMFRDFDVCFHLAAFTETETQSPLVRVNDIGTQRLLDCLRERLKGTRIVYTSSVAVTDCVSSVAAPRTEYARTKLAGEAIVMNAAERGGGAWTVSRLPTVIGPGYRPGGMFAVVANGLKGNRVSTRLAWQNQSGVPRRCGSGASCYLDQPGKRERNPFLECTRATNIRRADSRDCRCSRHQARTDCAAELVLGRRTETDLPTVAPRSSVSAVGCCLASFECGCRFHGLRR
jgi:nucleoside-diphosphate-sugar epimerase